jgi:hypothetical protein
MRPEVLTALFMKSVFLVAAPCRLLCRYHVPEEPAVSIIGSQEVYFLNPEDGGVSSSETSVTVDQFAKRFILEL